MIPCPHCDREFEKRSGLMRHVQATHPDTLEPVPVNPGGAIEPVVPVETYAEEPSTTSNPARSPTSTRRWRSREPRRARTWPGGPYVDPTR
jgi:hypothetical protein